MNIRYLNHRTEPVPPPWRWRSALQRHPLTWYFLLAFAFSWAVELPLVAVQQGWTARPIPFGLHYLAAFGPMLAGLIMTGVVAGRAGLGELWGRVTKWRVGWGWALLAIGSPPALFAFAALVARVVNGVWVDLRLLGQVNYLPYLGWGVLPLWLATFGFGEEIGWRGFALPRLQKHMSVARSTLILGLLWLLWHTPAYFYLDTLETIGLWMLPGFMFGVLCGAVLFTWLYNGTGGSVLMVAIWHALFDLLGASLASQGLITVFMSAGVIAWALLIANVDKPWSFQRLMKHTL